jgi:hypothetical protein
MRLIRQAALTLALLALSGFWAPSALADDAAALYDPSKMYVFKLTLTAKAKQALENPSTWQEYQEGGKFSWAVSSNGVPPSSGAFSTPEDVKIRLKGNYSFRNLTAKSAFKVKFPEAKPFKGLRVLTLNNMVNDPSMVRETLAYTAYRAAGVPASRTGYAYVYVDGVDYGIHLNIETMDKIALEKLLGPFNEDVQHLYEGEDGADVHPSAKAKFEVDEGEEADLSDLEALIAAVNSHGSQPWAQRVAAVADLEQMTTMWAVEKYIGQWDGYAGQEESWTPNNYYLYSDLNGVFQMLPWGHDESMQEHHRIPFDGAAGLMFDRCLEDQPCAALYRESVATVRDVIAGLDLDGQAVDTAALLAPWQAKEVKESTREEWGLQQMGEGLAAVRSFLASRPAAVAAWLGDEEEEGGGNEEGGGGEKAPPQGQAPPVSSPSPKSPARPIQGLRLRKAWLTGRVLRAKMRLQGPGVASLRATISTGKGARVLCQNRLVVDRPRNLILRCSLPASIGERLRYGPLDVTVAAGFVPAGGSPENVNRRITLPRA